MEPISILAAALTLAAKEVVLESVKEVTIEGAKKIGEYVLTEAADKGFSLGSEQLSPIFYDKMPESLVSDIKIKVSDFSTRSNESGRVGEISSNYCRANEGVLNVQKQVKYAGDNLSQPRIADAVYQRPHNSRFFEYIPNGRSGFFKETRVNRIQGEKVLLEVKNTDSNTRRFVKDTDGIIKPKVSSSYINSARNHSQFEDFLNIKNDPLNGLDAFEVSLPKNKLSDPREQSKLFKLYQRGVRLVAHHSIKAQRRAGFVS
jgi:hypothetical protein